MSNEQLTWLNSHQQDKPGFSWSTVFRRKRSVFRLKAIRLQISEFFWQAGYGTFTVDMGNRETVRRYIVSQEEHYREFSFKEEFLKILKEHELEWDEKYV